MRCVIAGGHGKIALLLSSELVSRGDQVSGLIRNPEHAAEVAAAGADPVRCDLEAVTAAELAAHLEGADAVVFAAGGGPGSGAARKETIDKGGAVVLADAAERAGVERYLLVSSMGTDTVAEDPVPRPETDEVFTTYLKAKYAAEEDLKSRQLQWTILRPGKLTDGAATGGVLLGRPSVGRDEVTRADVATVLAELLHQRAGVSATLELIGGDMPPASAVVDVG